MENSQLLTMLFIFCARILDVSMGTMRIILISRGYRFYAPLLGFFEILIWLFAIKTALSNLNSFASYVVYAAGFATGNYVGMWFESMISLGYQSIRIITRKHVSALPMHLREEGYGVTVVEGQGLKDAVLILYSVIKKKDFMHYTDIVKELEPEAFITVEDIRSHRHGFVQRKPFKYFEGRGFVKKK